MTIGSTLTAPTTSAAPDRRRSHSAHTASAVTGIGTSVQPAWRSSPSSPTLVAQDGRRSRRGPRGPAPSSDRPLVDEVQAGVVEPVEDAVAGQAVAAGHGVPGLDRLVLRLGREAPLAGVVVQEGHVGRHAHDDRQHEHQGGRQAGAHRRPALGAGLGRRRR